MFAQYSKSYLNVKTHGEITICTETCRESEGMCRNMSGRKHYSKKDSMFLIPVHTKVHSG